jgi:hypothetical protein
MDIKITVDTRAATAMLAGMSGPMMAAKLSAGLREAALFGERAVATNTPVKTGALRASVKATAQGPLAWTISSPLPYAAAVEAGTRAHEIRPRGRFLRFTVGSTVVFVKRVRHPGTTGRQMFAKGAQALQSALPGIFSRILGAGR